MVEACDLESYGVRGVLESLNASVVGGRDWYGAHKCQCTQKIESNRNFQGGY